MPSTGTPSETPTMVPAGSVPLERDVAQAVLDARDRGHVVHCAQGRSAFEPVPYEWSSPTRLSFPAPSGLSVAENPVASLLVTETRAGGLVSRCAIAHGWLRAAGSDGSDEQPVAAGTPMTLDVDDLEGYDVPIAASARAVVPTPETAPVARPLTELQPVD